MSILSTAASPSNRHVVFAGAEDLLEDFFAIRFATANAKVFANYLQFVLGFQEIAYSGLETGAMFQACHVLRCNDIIFEVVSPLYYIDVGDSTSDTSSESSGEWEEFEEEGECFRAEKGGMGKAVQAGTRAGVSETRDGLPETRASLSETTANVSGTKPKSEPANTASKSWPENQKSKKDRRDEDLFAQMLGLPKFKAFMSEHTRTPSELQRVLMEMFSSAAVSRFVLLHGAGVLDVSFRVSDAEQVFSRAVANGAVAVQEPVVLQDGLGSVVMAVLGSPYSDVRHTIVQNVDYCGVYLPHYGKPVSPNAVSVPAAGIPPAYSLDTSQEVYESGLLRVDHCVQNFSWNQMKRSAAFYAACFGMSKFWAVTEKDVATPNSGLHSTVMASHNGRVKMPINEPARVKRRGQIEEFYDFHGGPGVQHIALQTADIVRAVEFLRSRGMAFNSMHAEYYDELKQRLAAHKVRLVEDFDTLRRLNILVDFDPNSRYLYRDSFYTCHYILQIFTKPVQDRPTFFFEVIQRRHHDGFGKGTFKGLFETIEREQMLRGTL